MAAQSHHRSSLEQLVVLGAAAVVLLAFTWTYVH